MVTFQWTQPQNITKLAYQDNQRNYVKKGQRQKAWRPPGGRRGNCFDLGGRLPQCRPQQKGPQRTTNSVRLTSNRSFLGELQVV